MTKTGYAFGMSTTPSDPDYINTKALARFVRVFDHALRGSSMGAMLDNDKPQQNAQCVIDEVKDIVESKMRASRPRQKQTFGDNGLTKHKSRRWGLLLATLRCLRDDIRLRRYNREWLKNNNR